MKYVICTLAISTSGLGSVLLANNSSGSNRSTSRQYTTAGVNNAGNFSQVNFNLRWDNCWRHTSTNQGIGYIGSTTGGIEYTEVPKSSIGSQGSVTCSAITSISSGSLLHLNFMPDRSYVLQN